MYSSCSIGNDLLLGFCIVSIHKSQRPQTYFPYISLNFVLSTQGKSHFLNSFLPRQQCGNLLKNHTLPLIIGQLCIYLSLIWLSTNDLEFFLINKWRNGIATRRWSMNLIQVIFNHSRIFFAKEVGRTCHVYIIFHLFLYFIIAF